MRRHPTGMAEGLSYTGEEFAALQAIAETRGGELTQEMPEVYTSEIGQKLTPEALSEIFPKLGKLYDPYENTGDDTPSRRGKRAPQTAANAR